MPLVVIFKITFTPMYIRLHIIQAADDSRFRLPASVVSSATNLSSFSCYSECLIPFPVRLRFSENVTGSPNQNFCLRQKVWNLHMLSQLSYRPVIFRLDPENGSTGLLGFFAR
jgi:hypothetical protein